MLLLHVLQFRQTLLVGMEIYCLGMAPVYQNHHLLNVGTDLQLPGEIHVHLCHQILFAGMMK
jgi:hypothetical protein